MSDDEDKPDFGDRTDLERIGQFVDGPYDNEVILERADIKQLMGRKNTRDDEDDLLLDGPWLASGFKIKAATNDWTFSPFLYLWEEEPYEDPDAWRRAYKAEQKEKNLSEDPFISSFGSKTMNGLGTYYGTFIKDMEAFSPETKDSEEDDRLKGVANFLTNPGKKGNGYGYVDICLNPYPENMEDPLPDSVEIRREMREEHESLMVGETWIPTAHPGGFFDPNPYIDSNDPDGTIETYDWDRLLLPGSDAFLEGPWIPNSHTKHTNGNKDVIAPLEKFPEYDPSSPYEDPKLNISRTINPELNLDGHWKPQFGNRKRFQCSTLQYCVNLCVNPMTFHCQSIYR